MHMNCYLIKKNSLCSQKIDSVYDSYNIAATLIFSVYFYILNSEKTNICDVNFILLFHLILR